MPNRSDLTHEDVLRILQIVDGASDMDVRVEIDGLKLHVQKGNAGKPTVVAVDPTSTEESSAAPSSVHTKSEAEPSPPPTPVTESVTQDTPQSPTGPELAPGSELICAPMLGRFFRAPSPSEPPYIQPGDQVGPDDPICLLEVMKVFNTVRAGVRGTIVEVLVEDQEMVEQDQPLFVINTG